MPRESEIEREEKKKKKKVPGVLGARAREGRRAKEREIYGGGEGSDG